MLSQVVIDCLRFGLLVTCLVIMVQIMRGDCGHEPILLVGVHSEDKDVGVRIIGLASTGRVTVQSADRGSGQHRNMCTRTLKSNVTLWVGCAIIELVGAESIRWSTEF